MAVVTAVLLSILVFLYAKTQSFDESHYFEDIAVLRHLKQLDAQWEPVSYTHLTLPTNREV